MSNADIKDTLLRILEDIAPEGDFDDLEPDESLREQLDLDSMNFLQAIQQLSTQLGVDVPEIDYPKLDSLDGAVGYLKEKLG